MTIWAPAAVAGPPSVGLRGTEGREGLLEALDDADRWQDAAASLLADLGFRLIGPAGSARDSWHLLVALRAAPTLRHFDPELLAYYARTSTGATLETLGRSETGDPDATRRALWGQVLVVDRIPVENRFLTFGGELRTAEVDAGFMVVDLATPAPIVRWGGHSQSTDELTQSIGAFFGRLMVPIDFVPGAESRVDEQPPGVLYRAFLADGLRRAAAAERHGLERAGLGAWLASAWHRAREDADACDAAQRLLRELRLDGPSA